MWKGFPYARNLLHNSNVTNWVFVCLSQASHGYGDTFPVQCVISKETMTFLLVFDASELKLICDGVSQQTHGRATVVKRIYMCRFPVFWIPDFDCHHSQLDVFRR